MALQEYDLAGDAASAAEMLQKQRLALQSRLHIEIFIWQLESSFLFACCVPLDGHLHLAFCYHKTHDVLCSKYICKKAWLWQLHTKDPGLKLVYLLCRLGIGGEMSKVMNTEDLVGDQDLLDNGRSAKAAGQKAESQRHGADELLSNMKGTGIWHIEISLSLEKTFSRPEEGFIIETLFAMSGYLRGGGLDKVTEELLEHVCYRITSSGWKLLRQSLTGLSAREQNQLKRKLKQAGKGAVKQAKKPKIEPSASSQAVSDPLQIFKLKLLSMGLIVSWNAF